MPSSRALLPAESMEGRWGKKKDEEGGKRISRFLNKISSLPFHFLGPALPFPSFPSSFPSLLRHRPHQIGFIVGVHDGGASEHGAQRNGHQPKILPQSVTTNEARHVGGMREREKEIVGGERNETKGGRKNRDWGTFLLLAPAVLFFGFGLGLLLLLLLFQLSLDLQTNGSIVCLKNERATHHVN